MSQSAMDRVVAQFSRAVAATHRQRGDETISLARESLRDVMRFCRDDDQLQMNFLIDLTCVDYLGQEPRFEVVYHLYSLTRRQRLRIKVRVPEEDCAIDTVSDLWKTANWLEREVWDFYGVRFRGHPDLRRILLYEEFEGFPLRKDYPVDKRQPLARRAGAPKRVTWSAGS